MGILHDSGEINWTHTGPEKFEPKVEFFENLTFCPVALAWVLRSPPAQWPKNSLGCARRSLAPWRRRFERVWAPKIDPKVRKTIQNQPKLKFSGKVKNCVFHVEMANFSPFEDPDTHFIVKITIFSDPG